MSLLKTKITSEFWGGDYYHIELPYLYVGDLIHLSMTIPSFASIEGIFEVEDTLHTYNTKVGYVQKVRVKPLDNYKHGLE